MRYQGKITRWKDGQGFGFIAPNGGGPEVFVHIKAFTDRSRRPADLEVVTYELVVDPEGRGRAVNVAYAGVGKAAGTVVVGKARRSAPVASSGAGGASPWLALLFLALVVGLAAAGKLRWAVPALYFGASLAAFATYAWDKAAARDGEWRVPELNLHLLALAGGWPGALAAQRVMRHKTQKKSFRGVFWGTVVLNCGVLLALATPQGAGALRALLGVPA